MGAVPAITAGVSLISGVANISAKNKAADAERARISAQSYQQAMQQMANERTLATQQQLAQSEYNMGIMARLAQFQQQDMALQAQQSSAALQAQQQKYALESNQLERTTQAVQQADQLQRGAAATQMGANQRRMAGDAAATQVAGQGANALNDVVQALTAAERKDLSLQSAGNLSTSSADIAQQRELKKRLADVFSMGADLDSTQVQAALQNFNEQQLADIGERLGLLDNAAGAGSVAANLRLLGITTNAGLDANSRSYDNNYSTIDLARQQAGMMSAMGMQSAGNQYVAQDTSLGVQRAINRETGLQQQQLNQSAMNQVKGASLFDYLNTAVGTANAALGGTGGLAGLATKLTSPTTASAQPKPVLQDVPITSTIYG